MKIQLSAKIKINILLIISLCYALMACKEDTGTKESNGCIQLSLDTTKLYFPARDLKSLFVDVQLSGIFEDQKTFVDCSPKTSPQSIVDLYNKRVSTEGFDLQSFVIENFDLPSHQPGNKFNSSDSLSLHLSNLWQHLTRYPSGEQNTSSIIPLPCPYVVPGGRFREIFYWDSYFTMLGLMVSDRTDLVKNMLDNFAYLIDNFGFIPNGNRTYFLSRSQPPFFASMVMLYAEYEGVENALLYLPQLEKEYEFWMKGKTALHSKQKIVRNSVLLEDNAVLNRYWDEDTSARPESFKHEYDIAGQYDAVEKAVFYKHIRAACESGWDFSSRWFADQHNIETIRTTQIIPVDLNSLLYNLEETLSELHHTKGDETKFMMYKTLADTRKELILKYCWNEEKGIFMDYNFVSGQHTGAFTLAACFPLFFNVADDSMANKTAGRLRESFLQPGGVVTSLIDSGEQWDYPNGWAPLQWITIIGLENYKLDMLAKEIASRWLTLNEKVFEASGKMMEKYNVVDTTLVGGGGEYPNQDGFGWTNGVYLALKNRGYE